MESERREKWLILYSIGTGPYDGEVRIFNGTVPEMQQFLVDTAQDIPCMAAPLYMVLKAINNHMLTLEKLGLTNEDGR